MCSLPCWILGSFGYEVGMALIRGGWVSDKGWKGQVVSTGIYYIHSKDAQKHTETQSHTKQDNTYIHKSQNTLQDLTNIWKKFYIHHRGPLTVFGTVEKSFLKTDLAMFCYSITVFGWCYCMSVTDLMISSNNMHFTCL